MHVRDEGVHELVAHRDTVIGILVELPRSTRERTSVEVKVAHLCWRKRVLERKWIRVFRVARCHNIGALPCPTQVRTKLIRDDAAILTERVHPEERSERVLAQAVESLVEVGERRYDLNDIPSVEQPRPSPPPVHWPPEVGRVENLGSDMVDVNQQLLQKTWVETLDVLLRHVGLLQNPPVADPRQERENSLVLFALLAPRGRECGA